MHCTNMREKDPSHCIHGIVAEKVNPSSAHDRLAIFREYSQLQLRIYYLECLWIYFRSARGSGLDSMKIESEAEIYKINGLTLT
jgi:hypothetical protein